MFKSKSFVALQQLGAWTVSIESCTDRCFLFFMAYLKPTMFVLEIDYHFDLHVFNVAHHHIPGILQQQTKLDDTYQFGIFILPSSNLHL